MIRPRSWWVIRPYHLPSSSSKQCTEPAKCWFERKGRWATLSFVIWMSKACQWWDPSRTNSWVKNIPRFILHIKHLLCLSSGSAPVVSRHSCMGWRKQSHSKTAHLPSRLSDIGVKPVPGRREFCRVWGWSRRYCFERVLSSLCQWLSMKLKARLDACLPTSIKAGPRHWLNSVRMNGQKICLFEPLKFNV
jgi:hypothetical protein